MSKWKTIELTWQLRAVCWLVQQRWIPRRLRWWVARRGLK